MIHVIVISYLDYLKMEGIEDKLLIYIKQKLKRSDPNIDLNQINLNTDLVDLGVESIVIISLIAEIEEKFKINISLASLEKYNFSISVKSICECINE